MYTLFKICWEQRWTDADYEHDEESRTHTALRAADGGVPGVRAGGYASQRWAPLLVEPHRPHLRSTPALGPRRQERHVTRSAASSGSATLPTIPVAVCVFSHGESVMQRFRPSLSTAVSRSFGPSSGVVAGFLPSAIQADWPFDLIDAVESVLRCVAGEAAAQLETSRAFPSSALASLALRVLRFSGSAGRAEGV